MKLFTIAWKDILLLWRDKRALLTLVGTPLILTFILGIAFSSMWNSSTPPSRILYLNQDQGQYGTMLFEEVFALEGIREWVVLEPVTDKAEALERVRRGQATAFILVPLNFSSSLSRGSSEILVAGDPGSSIRANIITQIVQRFAAELSTRIIIQSALDQPLSPDQVEAALLALSLEVRVEDGFTPVEQQGIPVAMDYYAAGMGVMYLLFTVSQGASSFLRERETLTLARMYQSPAPPWQIGAGKFIGLFATAFTQMTAVILFSTFVFRVNWGNPTGVMLLTGAAAFAASGLGLMIAALSKTASAAGALGTMIVLPSSVLGGSMMPLFALPPVVRTLSKFTVNGWAMDGYIRLMFEGAGPVQILQPSLVLLAGGLGLIIIAGSVLARKGVTP